MNTLQMAGKENRTLMVNNRRPRLESQKGDYFEIRKEKPHSVAKVVWLVIACDTTTRGVTGFRLLRSDIWWSTNWEPIWRDVPAHKRTFCKVPDLHCLRANGRASHTKV